MKIIRMNASSFWKGEAGVKGLVEDQGKTYNVTLYLGSGRVKDYSCSCAKGNSYKGMCAHGEALFAYYRQQKEEGSKPPVHTSNQAHTMIREYTNREVAQILAEDEVGRVRLVPVLVISARDIRLEFKAGITRFYALRDLSAFREAVENGTYVEYGKDLGFHHQKSAFEKESQSLLSLLLGVTENQKAVRDIGLSRMNRDRFFSMVMGQELEVQIPGGIKVKMDVLDADPVMALKVSKYGRDGLKVEFQGVADGRDQRPCRMIACLKGERHLYVVSGHGIYCCSEAFTTSMEPFLEQIEKEGERSVLIGNKDIPLFYERVIRNISPYSRLLLEDVDFNDYEPEPLRAAFRFDTGEHGELLLEPSLSYGEYTFHPLEDENLPKTICRDVPGECRVSRLIQKYFKYKDPEGMKLVIRDDEDAVYRLLESGMEEFRLMGEVYISESLREWKILPSPKVSVGVGVSSGWLELSVDMGDLKGEELSRILAAYSQKKKYYRLKSGQFLRLGDGGLFTVSQMAADLGLSKKELQKGTFRLPAYRALYLDHLLKESPGVAYYRDQLLKAMVRGIKSVEDSDYPVPKAQRGVLREYQRVGYCWLKTLDSYGFGGILADDMGLGKTLQIITLLEDAYEGGEQQPSLIVCPASLVYNWEHEIGKFAPELKVLSIVGNGPEREEKLKAVIRSRDRFNVLVTSYDLLKRDMACYQEIRFRYQVIDEAQYIKNAATQSAKAVKSIDVKTRFALTGTPVENRLSELWSIFDYLMPGFLFGSQYFKKEYETPIVKERDEDALLRLRRIIGPFVLRRVKRDVLKELPEKLEQVVYSNFEDEQKKLYTANAVQLKEKLESGGFAQAGEGKLQILAELMRLRQICCDPRLCYENYRNGSAKLETCMDLIRRGVSGEHKILLFSQFTSMLELVEARLLKEDIKCHKLTGSTSKEDRIRMVGEFQRDDVPVFLISLKAGGTGLNLTAADIVIHYDPWWNVAAQNQATDRTHRIGQEKQVTVYKLITRNTIEENILKLQESKQYLADQIVTEGTVSFGSLTREDILNIVTQEVEE
ncbi:DEAD/DEAH box helicase [Enterocloster citroniae]|uniref:DEAD/DEAH box helicase n=1 Tax=Enterocloster citroniae TaxID=358743 RepID=UPI001D08753E|nr:DEAD/DEAH box helicase [Enterocloster citroniae]MCB7062362.1 SNF2 family helicase [Enterocloster citroniae]MCD8281560.1 SNF2 family helicase [Enterocloster citroniae]